MSESVKESEDLALPIPAPTDKTHMAGFFIRGMAFFVDLIILNVLFLILVLVANLAMKIALKGLYLESSSDELIRLLMGIYPSIWFFLFFIYFTFFMAYGGQTPAKMLLRIRVLTKDQQPLTRWKAILRTIGYFISGLLLLGLGFLV
ncbi:MAG: RDD family protein, partial [Nitrospira sp.]|nr:RDD family protein [Nitrospira sp.]